MPKEETKDKPPTPMEKMAKPIRIRKVQCDSFDEVHKLVNQLLERTSQLAAAIAELQAKPKSEAKPKRTRSGSPPFEM